MNSDEALSMATNMLAAMLRWGPTSVVNSEGLYYGQEYSTVADTLETLTDLREALAAYQTVQP